MIFGFPILSVAIWLPIFFGVLVLLIGKAPLPSDVSPLASRKVHHLLAVLLFCVGVNHAQAVVESVQPASTQLICLSSELGCSGPPGYYDGVPPHPFSIKYSFESAQAWCSSKNLEWSYISNASPYAYRCNMWVFTVISSICPTATPAYMFNPRNGMCERPVVATCPIPEFPDINASDACTKSLEKGAGKDVDNACEPLDSEMVKQEICLANKIRRLGIGYTEPSATVRTVAYQQHFVDLWKWHEIKILTGQEIWSDAEKQACAPIVAKVNAEWEKHKLNGQPSNSGPDAPHVQRKAVDIDRGIVTAMMAEVDKTTFLVPFPTYCFLCLPEYPVYIGDVQDYVNSPLVNPPACKLRWGGRFQAYDPVHFDLLLK